MKNLPLILVVLVLVLLAAAAFGIHGLNRSANEPIDPGIAEPQACTQEAKICPDGSAVGRTGPNCEFAQCPAVITPTPTNPGSNGGGNDMGIGDGSTPSSTSGSACIAQGGTWDSPHRECVGVGESQCSAIGGTFNECASACRHNPEAEMCTLQCVQVCQFR